MRDGSPVRFELPAGVRGSLLPLPTESFSYSVASWRSLLVATSDLIAWWHTAASARRSMELLAIFIVVSRTWLDLRDLDSFSRGSILTTQTSKYCLMVYLLSPAVAAMNSMLTRDLF